VPRPFLLDPHTTKGLVPRLVERSGRDLETPGRHHESFGRHVEIWTSRGDIWTSHWDANGKGLKSVVPDEFTRLCITEEYICWPFDHPIQSVIYDWALRYQVLTIVKPELF